jgi:hypothetical protein
LHAALGLKRNEVAHLMVRYGRGPLAPYSLRRPISRALVDVRMAHERIEAGDAAGKRVMRVARP